MARVIQLEVPSDVSDNDVEYAMDMLRIIGKYISGGEPVVVRQGALHTSL